MKKVLLSLLAVSALVLSCQNYDEEFDSLNSKIASLEAQIKSFDDLRTAVTGVQSSVSSLQSAVTAAAATSTANASAIAGLATSLAAISDDITDLQTAVAAASTTAELDALKTELTSTLAALDSLIDENSDAIALLILNDASLATTIASLGVDVELILSTVYTYEGDLVINDLASLAFAQNLGGKVKAIKGNVSVDLNASNTEVTLAAVNAITSQIINVNGNVVINGYNASVDLSSLTNVTGDYTVTGFDALDDALENVGDDVYFNYDGAYVSNLKVADNIYLYANVASTTAPVKSGTTGIEFMSLIKASGIQTINSSGIASHTSGGSAHTSGGSVSVASLGEITAGASSTNTLNLSAATTVVKIAQAPVKYVFGTKLETLELHYTSAGTASSAALDFLTINGAALTSATVKATKVTGAVSVTAKTTGSTLTMDDATILTTVSSNAVTNSFIGLTQVGTLTLSGATSPSLPALTKATGAITCAAATSISLPVLATATSITAGLVTGTVSLPALTSGTAMSFAKATAFDAKLATVTSVDLDATKAIVIDLGNIVLSGDGTTQFPDLAKITKLNLHAQSASIASANLSGAAMLTDMIIIGKANTTKDGMGRVGIDVVLDGTSGFAKLDKLTVIGVNDELSVSNMSKLTSLTTGGEIHVLIFDNNDLVKTGLTFGHTENATIGSYTKITNNAILEGFTTSFNKPYWFEVANNPKLAKFDASSLTSLPNDIDESVAGNVLYSLSQMKFVVDTNFTTVAFATATGMKGTYVGDTASSNETFGEESLNSMKPILTALYDGAYVGTVKPYAAFANGTGGKSMTVTLNYISAPTAAEVTAGKTADGVTVTAATVSVKRSVSFQDGEVADITAE